MNSPKTGEEFECTVGKYGHEIRRYDGGFSSLHSRQEGDPQVASNPSTLFVRVYLHCTAGSGSLTYQKLIWVNSAREHRLYRAI